MRTNPAPSLLNLASFEKLKSALQHLESFGFLNFVESKNALLVNKFGHPGVTIANQIRHEWLYSNVVFRDQNVYLVQSSDSSKQEEGIFDDFKDVKTINRADTPFGIAQIESPKLCEDVPMDGLVLPSRSVLRYLGFFDPREGSQFYYRWQQERKRWWRYFSTDPGRFSFADTGGADKEAVIEALFPWGKFRLETIKFHGDTWFKNTHALEDYVLSGNRKKVIPHVVESEASLETATVLYMFDAFREVKAKERKVLQFHRKLAPYKFGFAAPQVSAPVRQELMDLAKMVGLQIRKQGLLSILPSANFGNSSLDSQFTYQDSLGVPFVLVFRPNTLETGILGLRSRDTTLEEEVHTGKAASYCSLIIQNY